MATRTRAARKKKKALRSGTRRRAATDLPARTSNHSSSANKISNSSIATTTTTAPGHQNIASAVTHLASAGLLFNSQSHSHPPRHQDPLTSTSTSTFTLTSTGPSFSAFRIWLTATSIKRRNSDISHPHLGKHMQSIIFPQTDELTFYFRSTPSPDPSHGKEPSQEPSQEPSGCCGGD